MKKLLFVLLPILFVSQASGEVAIFEDFYITDGAVIDEDTTVAEIVLPSALRVCLTEGEGCELYADLFPENTTERGLHWRILEGGEFITISPGKAGCEVLGRAPGKARLRVSASGGAAKEIEIEITPGRKEVKAPEGGVEEEEKKEEKSSGDFPGRLPAVLSLGGVLLLLSAAVLRLKRKTASRKGKPSAF